MKLADLPSHIQAFVRPLIDLRHVVWLLGSRANGTHTETSDWDFMVFGSDSLVEVLANAPAPRDVDALIVYDGDQFRSPWPREVDGWVKSGSLSQWAWSEVSDGEAKYISSKPEDAWNTVRWAKAVRVVA